MPIITKEMKVAFKSSLPIIFGYLPTGFGFGLMLTSLGYNALVSVIMSIVIFAGAGQYLAVELFRENAGLVKIAIFIFLINSKHLFYGLSLINEFKNMGLKKIYMIFSLTDETYAVLTSSKPKEDMDIKKYYFYVAFFNQCGWVVGTLIGGLFGTFIKFNTDGLDFALTALFLVIVIEQLRVFKTKWPFLIGIFSALVAYFAFGAPNILIGGSCIAVLLLIILRKRIESNGD